MTAEPWGESFPPMVAFSGGIRVLPKESELLLTKLLEGDICNHMKLLLQRRNNQWSA